METRLLQYAQVPSVPPTAQVPPSRQVARAFLRKKAQEFIGKHQACPCDRKSRRKAAREVASRFMKRMNEAPEVPDATL